MTQGFKESGKFRTNSPKHLFLQFIQHIQVAIRRFLSCFCSYWMLIVVFSHFLFYHILNLK